jgi:hypothetical protein
MDEPVSRHVRARAFLRGLIAWVYLATGLLVLPLMLDLLLHESGLITGSLLPVAAELGGWLLGLLIFLGWPFAMAIAWFLRRDRVLALPALLFLAAELMVGIYFQSTNPSGLLLSLAGIAGAAFAVGAIRAWAIWIRDRA